MDCVHIGDLCSGDHRRHVQIALRKPWRADADRLVGKTHVQRMAVRLAVDGDRANPQLPARIQHAQSNLAAIGNQNFTKHE